MSNQQIYQFILEVSQQEQVETEYDGRMYYRCPFCGNQEGHDKDCLISRSLVLLQTHFPELEQQRQENEQRIKDEQTADSQRRYEERIRKESRKYIHCVCCRTQILRVNIKSHTNSKACKKAQRALGLDVGAYKFEVQKPLPSSHERYIHNKDVAKMGDEIICPCCPKTFIKRTYQHIFFDLSHKDKYWNKNR